MLTYLPCERNVGNLLIPLVISLWFNLTVLCMHDNKVADVISSESDNMYPVAAICEIYISMSGSAT